LCSVGADSIVGQEESFNKEENRLILERARRIRTPVHESIKLIVITDDTDKKLGLADGASVPRSLHGRLVHLLDQAGAKVALFDLYFDDPGRGDAEFKNELRALNGQHLQVTLGNKYVEGAMAGEDFEVTPRGIRGRYLPSAIFEPSMRPRVEMGGMSATVPKGGKDFVGAPAIEEDIGSTRTELYCAYQAALQYLDLGSQKPLLEANGTRLRAGTWEWSLPFNQGVLIAWPTRLDEFQKTEYSDALRILDGPRASEFKDKLVVIGVDKPEVDRVQTAPFDDVPGCLVVAGIANTLLQPPSQRLFIIPDEVYYPVAAILSAMSFVFGYSRRALVAVAGTALLGLAAWSIPLGAINAYCVVPQLALLMGVLAAGLLGLVAAQSPLYRDDHRVEGATEEATALFVDVRGSTALLQEIGHEAFRQRVSPFLLYCDRAIARHGGTLERTQGDGCLAIFRSKPGRHHSLRCAEAALAIMNEALRLGLLVGIGFETGMVTGAYLKERGKRIWSSVGGAVNLAQRLQAASEVLGAKIVVGPVASRLIREEYPTRPLGTIEAKGFDGVVDVFAVDP
jgi:class 3 adenylate cyclase